MVKTGSNRWQLDSKTEKVSSLSSDRGTLTSKCEYLNLPTYLDLAPSVMPESFSC